MINSHIHLDFNNTHSCGNIAIVPAIGKINWHKVINYQFYTLGIHPWKITQHTTDDINTLESLINNQNPIAIGECGLDYNINIDQKIQKFFFISQLNLAQKYNLPVVIHAVKSLDNIIAILKDYKIIAQIHGFTGSIKQAEILLTMGHYISFGIYKKSLKLLNFIKDMPINKILIETDEQNDKLLIKVAQEIACIKNISLKNLIKNCDNNATKIFNLS